MHHIKIITHLLSPKNVIYADQSEVLTKYVFLQFLY